MSTLRFLLASNNVNCDRQYAKVLIHKLLRFVSQTVQLIPRSLTSLLTSTLAVVLQLIGMHEHALEKQNIVLILVLAKQNDSSIRALCFEILARASLDKACLQQIMEELN